MNQETKDKLSELKDSIGWMSFSGMDPEWMSRQIMKLIDILIEDKNDSN